MAVLLHIISLLLASLFFAGINHPGWKPLPHDYSIFLTKNHTLEKHWEHIGKELRIISYHKHQNDNHYWIDFEMQDVEDVDEFEEETLALIRSDPNVESVEQNFVGASGVILLGGPRKPYIPTVPSQPQGTRSEL